MITVSFSRPDSWTLTGSTIMSGSVPRPLDSCMAALNRATVAEIPQTTGIGNGAGTVNEPPDNGGLFFWADPLRHAHTSVCLVEHQIEREVPGPGSC